MSVPRLHIGHHFFGSGNVGDDLMLAGFLDAVGPGAELTCCSACDIDSQRRRFPQVRWLPYTMEARAAAVQACHAWVGVGDTPFQLSVGPWFLEHLRGELELCRRHGKRMFFIGVGVGDVEALRDERAAEVLGYASRVWSRDEWSAGAIRASGACDPQTVAAGADLAHAYLHRHRFGPVEPDVIGYVLNFEDRRQFDARALCEVVRENRHLRQRWLAQEVRPLAGSETELFNGLPPGNLCRGLLEWRCPDYPSAASADLLASWGVPSRIVSSRYHAALVGAWMRARVVAVERSAKVTGLVSELKILGLPALHDASALRAALAAAVPVPADLLHALADRAVAGCAELLRAV